MGVPFKDQMIFIVDKGQFSEKSVLSDTLQHLLPICFSTRYQRHLTFENKI